MKFIDKLRNSISALIITGLILLIINIVLDLGISTITFIQETPVLKWFITIVSTLFSTIGLALILNASTKLFNKNEDELQSQVENENKRYSEQQQKLKTILKDEISNMVQNTIISYDFINKLSDGQKDTIIKSCILNDKCFDKQSQYIEHKIIQLQKLNCNGIRSNIVYTTTASISNNKVLLHTVMSYQIYRVGDKYPKIEHIFDKKSSKVKEMAIITKNNKSKPYKIDKKYLETTEMIKHHNETAYINSVDIPAKFQSEEKLTLKITVEEEGYDHWAHLVWMSLYPTDTISYKIICNDNLIIKDINIFDNQKGLYYTQFETNQNNQITTYTISCDEWTDPYTGFSLIISKP